MLLVEFVIIGVPDVATGKTIFRSKTVEEILNTPTQYDGVWFLFRESISLFTHNPK